MINGLMGRKVGMTRVFEEGHGMIAVTVIQAGPCYVTQLKTTEKDGYEAVQIGFEESRKLSKAERGHLQKNGLPQLRQLTELRTVLPKSKVGDKIDVGVSSTLAIVVNVIGNQQGPWLHRRGEAARLRRRPKDARAVRPAQGGWLYRVLARPQDAS